MPRSRSSNGAPPKLLRIPLQAVLYQRDGIWLAHCLEFDLIGDGDTPKEALALLAKAITSQIKACVRHKCLDTLFAPAEQKFWAMFAAGKNVAAGSMMVHKKIASVLIEDLQARTYAEDDEDAHLLPAS